MTRCTPRPSRTSPSPADRHPGPRIETAGTLVRDEAPQADDLRPFNLRSLVSRLPGDLRGSLTDDNEVVQLGISGFPIELARGDVFAECCDRLADIVQAQLLATAHSGTAS